MSRLPLIALGVAASLVVVGVAILTADLTSAVIVALTIPLIPVFMALVGWTTEARTAKRWHRSAVASGEYVVATVETLTSTGARREARALVMDAATLQAVRETIAGRRG